ncbi:nitronate monooxygenase [Staphylococcus sp. SQ8-PEA]|uniref:Probable nitronate monooxygenase n=1 Tax=Staphylococcus marylandisciuri TaxID=2981529 RepID=A0ABT2QPM6_9STAP|nr:nitronate monooxygenase [Staphylococcus marylandisciuri]MCU5745927.1 nitronate monooxygenase [Staphylococcus marylandisciuri]
MKLETALTHQLNIKYPIIQAGMAGSTTPELVATVSNKGGLGMIGAGYMSPDQLAEEITQVQELTDLDFAVNLFVPADARYSSDDVNKMQEYLQPLREEYDVARPEVDMTKEEDNFNGAIELVVQMHVPVVSFTFGIPNQHIIKRLKSNGITLIGTATSVEEATALESAGIDIIVAQGSEAGGHRGSFTVNEQGHTPLIGTMSLVPQIVDQVEVPVIAAGGIMDGRGLVAGLALGASAVQLGTAFLTTDESGASQLKKASILQSDETQTVITHVYSGKMARGISNQFVSYLNQFDGRIPEYPIQNQLTTAIRKASAQRGDEQFTHLWCGQTPRLAQSKRASELVDQIIAEARKILE